MMENKDSTMTFSTLAILRGKLHKRASLFTIVFASATVLGAAITVSETRVQAVKAPKGAFAAEIAAAGNGSADMRTVIVYVQNADEVEQPDAQIKRFIKLFAQKARLDAERLGSADVIFPVGFEMASNRSQSVAEAERRVFLAKRDSDENQKAQHLKRVEQLQKEGEGLRAQRKAKLSELELIRRELKLVDNLYKKNLTNEVRLIGMQRDLARFEGEDGALVSQIAKVEAQVHEVQLQISAIGKSTTLDAEKALRDVEAELNELIEQRTRTHATSGGGHGGIGAGPDVIHISSGHFQKLERTEQHNFASYLPERSTPGVDPNASGREPGTQMKKKRVYNRVRRARGYPYRSAGFRISRAARRIFRFGL